MQRLGPPVVALAFNEMTAATGFLLGFLCAGLMCGVLACAYYVHAARRVRSIKEAIERYHEASKVVGERIKQTYGDK